MDIDHIRELSKIDFENVIGTSLYVKLLHHHVEVKRQLTWKTDDNIRRWLSESTKGLYFGDFVSSQKINLYFARADDMVAFKLFFGDKSDDDIYHLYSE